MGRHKKPRVAPSDKKKQMVTADAMVHAKIPESKSVSEAVSDKNKPGLSVTSAVSISAGPTSYNAEPSETWLTPMTTRRWVLFAGFFLWFGFIFVASFFSDRFHPARNLWWIFAFPLGVIGPAFIRARRLTLEAALRLLPQSDSPMNELVHRFVERHENGWDPAIVGIVSALAFGTFRIAASWDVREILYSWPFIMHTAFLIVGIGCMAHTIWLILYFGRLINAITLRLSEQADTLFSWSQISALGNSYARASLGVSLMSVAFLAMVLTNYQLFAGDMKTHALQIMLMEGVFACAVIAPILYLTVPQWRLRSLLMARKEILYRRHLPLLIEAEHAMLTEQRQSTASTERFLQRRRELREIEALPHWPFNLDAVAPMISVFAIPASIFLVKEVLVDVIVAWVKG